MALNTPTAPNLTGDILLEAGTNELEVLVFRLGAGSYGVNVAKVREVIRPAKTVVSPGQHPSVIGMFNIRGAVIPVVDLAKHLGLDKRWGAEAGAPEGRVIITEFNGLRVGFMVDEVDQIHRLSWQRVKPAPDTTTGTSAAISDTRDEYQASSITGIIEINSTLVLMLDFESVSDSILMERRLHVESVANELGVDRKNKRVLLVEDSPFMRARMTRVFQASGYDRLEIYPDGQAAWNAIEASVADPAQAIHAVISDIEMPKMDGLHLTKRIKSGTATAGIPVVLFSSLISDDNRKKGEQVGADVQIPKPELAEMVRLVDRVINGERIGVAQTSDLAA